jgi:holo-[acyl-carrier protein] synthase
MKGIGTDVVNVSRMQGILARTPAFARDVFTEGERAACEAQRRPARAYAARFAVKESFLKALGLGLWDGVTLRDVEVREAERGRPSLRLGPTARAALDRAGGGTPRVSFAGAGDAALAVVVIP